MQLQARFGTDSRFQIDSRFLESDDETEDQGNLWFVFRLFLDLNVVDARIIHRFQSVKFQMQMLQKKMKNNFLKRKRKV